MKSIYKRLIALVLSLTMILGCISLTSAKNTDAPAKATERTKTAADESAVQTPASDSQSVYVLTDASGAVERVILSERSREADGTEQSRQEDVAQEPPVELQFSYKLDGAEISPEELAGKSGAVEIRIDYVNHASAKRELNGKEETLYTPFLMLSALVLDNEQFENVEIENGKLVSDGSRTLAVGYALPGMQESLALPEDLDLTIPDHVTVRADVRDFSLGSVYTMASTELLQNYDENDPEALEKVLSSVQDLSDGMDRLLDGAKALNDGLDPLLEKSGDLQTGMAALSDGADQVAGGAKDLSGGAKALASGATELEDGASRLVQGASSLQSGSNDLAAGAEQLSSGLDQLSENSGALNSGAKAVFNSLLSAAETQLKANGLSVGSLTISNYQSELSRVISTLDPDAVYAAALSQVTAGVEAKRPEIEALVTEAAKEQVTQAVTAAVRQNVAQQVQDGAEAQIRAAVEENRSEIEAMVTLAVKEQVRSAVIKEAAGMDAEDYAKAVEAGAIDEATQAAVDAAVASKMASEEVQAQIADAVAQKIEETIQMKLAASETQQMIEAQIDEQMAAETVQSLIAQKIDEQMQSEAIRQSIADSTEAQVQKAIADTMASPEVQAKLQAADDGAKSVIALKTSLDQYNAFYLGLLTYTAGVDAAAQGAKDLSDGAKKLHSGAAELADGTAALSNGTKQVSSGASALSDGAAALYAGTSSLDRGVHALNDRLPDLLDGVEQLFDGSEQLRDGLQTFDEEGIQTITRLVNEDGRDLNDRLKALAELGRTYCSDYAGLSEHADGALRFIYRSAPIE